jgi:GntR family transcriptional regulator
VAVSKENPIPLYLQLYETLRAQIGSGELRPGDLVPTEHELMSLYQVSRITVRAALEQLVRDDLIERRRGKGTFVKATQPEERDCLVSFTDQMLRAGRVPTTELIRLGVINQGEANRMGLPITLQDKLVMIERLRKLEEQPVGLVRSYIPHHLVSGIAPKHFQKTGREQSLLYVLEHHFGIVLDKGEETIMTCQLNGNEARLLTLPADATVLLKRCIIYDRQGNLVLFEDALWNIPQTSLVQRRASASA